jgi:hypothetical protein
MDGFVKPPMFASAAYADVSGVHYRRTDTRGSTPGEMARPERFELPTFWFVAPDTP